MSTPEDRAKARFLTLSLLRIGLVLLALLGILMAQTNWLGEPRPWPGRILAGVAALALLFVPRALLRHWRRNP